jgi:hypothetical protein
MKNRALKIAAFKKLFLALMLVAAFNLSAQAQQWLGSATATGDLNRYGKVAIGVPTNSRIPIASWLTVNGLGKDAVDFKVNGRMQTGDANNLGGVWLNGMGTQFMGQIDANKMGLFNKDWHVALDNTGKMGIGTLSPKKNLELSLKNTTGGFRIGWGSQNPILNTDMGYPTTGEGFVINTMGASGLEGVKFKCNNVNKFVINRSNIWSNVPLGVGTSNPQTNLEVSQGNVDGGIRVSWGSQYSSLFSEIGYPKAGGLVINAKANGGWARMTFKCDDVQKMIISKENVSVDGLLIAEEIQVQDVGADYVFEENYKLRSLDEVEKFIKENKHLPGIAPAAQTEKGIKVSEFSEKMLEKIEELTLYVIELKNQNEALKKQVETLEKNAAK